MRSGQFLIHISCRSQSIEDMRTCGYECTWRPDMGWVLRKDGKHWYYGNLSDLFTDLFISTNDSINIKTSVWKTMTAFKTLSKGSGLS